MKNLTNNLLKTMALCAGVLCMMTSCLDGDDDQHSASGYFTVTGNKTTGYTLYQDGGGYIIPTAESVNDLTGGKGFGEIERAMLAFTFQEKDIAEDKNSIVGAKLYSGESLPVSDLLNPTNAAVHNVLDPDSLFAIEGIANMWAYRGYLTMIYTGQYAWNAKKTGWLYPGINVVYNAEDMIPNEVQLQLCHNERRAKTESAAGKQTFCVSFRLKELQHLVPGNDSIKVNLKVTGVDKPYVMKIAREDLSAANWR